MLEDATRMRKPKSGFVASFNPVYCVIYPYIIFCVFMIPLLQQLLHNFQLYTVVSVVEVRSFKGLENEKVDEAETED